MLLDIPDIRQREDYDCGAAAVDAIAQFWGVRKRGPAKLANAVQGMSPDSVEAVLRALGLSVLSGSMSAADLKHLTRHGRPVLCPITTDWGGHWVVVRGVIRRQVYYHCPTAGPTCARFPDWFASWKDSTSKGHIYLRWGICPTPQGGDRPCSSSCG